MKNTQVYADKTAIGLSILCTIHCLALPLIIILTPSFAALTINDESFHQWMLFAVVPISLVALINGYKKHQKIEMFIFGFLGLGFLAFAAFAGHDFVTETEEKILTVIGACIVSSVHIMNHLSCKNANVYKFTSEF